MNLRLIEVFLPEVKAQKLPELLQEYALIELWQLKVADGQTLFKILLSALEAETAIELLETHFAQVPGFRIILISVEATIPLPQLPETATTGLNQSQPIQPPDLQISRINRQELYTDISKSVVLSLQHILLVLLSTIIAAIGLLRNNSTIIIGAMVIAPLLGPNMALSLATILGEANLARKAIKIGAIGIFVALSFSVFVGYVFTVNPEIPEIAFRTKVSWSDVILAFASGMAGALSFTSGATSAIVGVMVAVALLPPLVTFGILLGAGFWQLSLGSLLLLLTNLICLNLAGVVTFSILRLRPQKLWDTDKANRCIVAAFGLWFVLLLTIIFGIILWQSNYQF